MKQPAMANLQVARLWLIRRELKALTTIWHGLEARALDLCEELENDFFESGLKVPPEVHSGFDLMQRLLLGVTPTRDVRVPVTLARK